MKRSLISYLKQQPDWLRMSISDLVWFLNTSEDRIRRLIDFERIYTAPETKYPDYVILANCDRTPHFVFKYQVMQLVRGLGISSVDHPEDFQERMDRVRDESMASPTDWKQAAMFKKREFAKTTHRI